MCGVHEMVYVRCASRRTCAWRHRLRTDTREHADFLKDLLQLEDKSGWRTGVAGSRFNHVVKETTPLWSVVRQECHPMSPSPRTTSLDRVRFAIDSEFDLDHLANGAPLRTHETLNEQL
ncbi:hypothetical protein EVAR_69287_1 [Eumeta japonica]|uniref:Uncharacterized protein n=1 Tax=Eumeta variegata TaxID=151549 RepID=A0A4C1S9Z6_EUMVA|nr:hypothetical protein EVAR_69287_1 [Eumeta japonica]